MTAHDATRGPSRPVRVWPLLLIAAGAFLLAANLGWVGWDALLDLWYLWPVVLVAVGADMLLGGRHRLLVVAGALVAGALLFVTTSGGIGASPGGVPEEVSQQLSGATRAEVSIDTGVTRLTVRGDPTAELLASGSVTPVRGERIARSFDVTGGAARFSLASRGSLSTTFGRGGTWDLTLTGRVPLALDIDTGVGEADLDLSGLRLTRLELSTGVGAAEVKLPRGDYQADVDTGVGAATIRIPEGVEARVTVSRGLGAVSVPADMTRDGDVYTSPGYASAAERIDLRIDGGVGAVAVVRYR